MVHRYIFVKLKDAYANSSGRKEVVRETLETLPKCEGVVSVSSGVPSDPESEKAWDVHIIVGFNNQDAVATYIIDPVHQKYVTTFLKPRTEVKKAWNFEVTTAS